MNDTYLWVPDRQFSETRLMRSYVQPNLQGLLREPAPDPLDCGSRSSRFRNRRFQIAPLRRLDLLARVPRAHLDHPHRDDAPPVAFGVLCPALRDVQVPSARCDERWRCVHAGTLYQRPGTGDWGRGAQGTVGSLLVRHGAGGQACPGGVREHLDSLRDGCSCSGGGQRAKGGLVRREPHLVRRQFPTIRSHSPFSPCRDLHAAKLAG